MKPLLLLVVVAACDSGTQPEHHTSTMLDVAPGKFLVIHECASHKRTVDFGAKTETIDGVARPLSPAQVETLEAATDKVLHGGPFEQSGQAAGAGCRLSILLIQNGTVTSTVVDRAASGRQPHDAVTDLIERL